MSRRRFKEEGGVGIERPVQGGGMRVATILAAFSAVCTSSLTSVFANCDIPQ
jgi:hypothetical protein